MILVHENLLQEAQRIAEVFKEIYGIDSELRNEDLEKVFVPLPEFNGYLYSTVSLYQYFADIIKTKKVLVLTSRDIYNKGVSKNDDWVFGHCSGNLSIVATARMKRKDSEPSTKIEVPLDLYLRRVVFTAVHEIGHDVVHSNHYEQAIWVNAKTNYRFPLGLHCTDNTCVMYEIVDIKAPPLDEGFMLLGKDKKYDTGLDDVIERVNPGWFCDRCKEAIEISDGYR